MSSTRPAQDTGSGRLDPDRVPLSRDFSAPEYDRPPDDEPLPTYREALRSPRLHPTGSITVGGRSVETLALEEPPTLGRSWRQLEPVAQVPRPGQLMGKRTILIVLWIFTIVGLALGFGGLARSSPLLC